MGSLLECKFFKDIDKLILLDCGEEDPLGVEDISWVLLVQACRILKCYNTNLFMEYFPKDVNPHWEQWIRDEVEKILKMFRETGEVE